MVWNLTKQSSQTLNVIQARLIDSSAIRDIALSLLILQVMPLMLLYNTHFQSRMNGTVVLNVTTLWTSTAIYSRSALPALLPEGESLETIVEHPPNSPSM